MSMSGKFCLDLFDFSVEFLDLLFERGRLWLVGFLFVYELRFGLLLWC